MLSEHRERRWLGVIFVFGVCCSSGKPALEACRDVAAAGEACIAGGTFVMGHDPIADPRSPMAQLPQTYAPAHRVAMRPFFSRNGARRRTRRPETPDEGALGAFARTIG